MSVDNLDTEVFKSLETGDLILFDSNYSGFYGYLDILLKYFTQNNFTHIGIVIKEEKLGNEMLDTNITYLWESGYEGTADPTDGKIKLGVQLTNLEEMIKTFQGKLWVRKLNCNKEDKKKIFNPEILAKLQAQVYGKPYDLNIVDWLGAFCRFDYQPQKIDRFWCSAFVGYIYTQVRILNEKTDWSILRPSDFSKEDNDKNLSYESNLKLQKTQTLLYSNI